MFVVKVVVGAVTEVMRVMFAGALPLGVAGKVDWVLVVLVCAVLSV